MKGYTKMITRDDGRQVLLFILCQRANSRNSAPKYERKNKVVTVKMFFGTWYFEQSWHSWENSLKHMLVIKFSA